MSEKKDGNIQLYFDAVKSDTAGRVGLGIFSDDGVLGSLDVITQVEMDTKEQ